LNRVSIKNALINLHCFFDRIADWGYDDAPGRPLIFHRGPADHRQAPAQVPRRRRRREACSGPPVTNPTRCPG